MIQLRQGGKRPPVVTTCSLADPTWEWRLRPKSAPGHGLRVQWRLCTPQLQDNGTGAKSLWTAGTNGGIWGGLLFSLGSSGLTLLYLRCWSGGAGWAWKRWRGCSGAMNLSQASGWLGLLLLLVKTGVLFPQPGLHPGMLPVLLSGHGADFIISKSTGMCPPRFVVVIQFC